MNGLQVCFGALSVPMFFGLLCTYFVPETKGLTLEELNDEQAPTISDAKVETVA